MSDHTAICFNCYQSYQVWHCSLHPRFLDRFSHIHRRQHSLARLYQTVFPAAARIVAVDRVLDLHAESNRSLTDTEECEDSEQPRILNQNIEDVNQSIAICISYMISIWFQYDFNFNMLWAVVPEKKRVQWFSDAPNSALGQWQPGKVGVLDGLIDVKSDMHNTQQLKCTTNRSTFAKCFVK